MEATREVRPAESTRATIAYLTSTAHRSTALGVEIPPFWRIDPEMWFAQVETQFALAGITSDETKFNHVAGNFDANYTTEVRDILTSPPDFGKYEKLKSELIRRLGTSQDHKTRELLENQRNGDRTPSQFLRHLQGLAGKVFSEEALRSIWLNRLPMSMQAILATQKQATLDQIAELADAIAIANPRGHIDAASSYTASAATAVPATAAAAVPAADTTALTALVQQMSLLTARVAEISLQLSEVTNRENRTRSRSRSRSQNRHRSRSRDFNSDGMCWYHSRYAERARNCQPPCNFTSGNDPGRR